MGLKESVTNMDLSVVNTYNVAFGSPRALVCVGLTG